MQFFNKILRPSHRFKYRVCVLPQRYIMALLLSCGVLALFTIRVSFQVVLFHMVVPPKIIRFANATITCKYSEPPTPPITTAKKYDWSESHQVHILQAFFLGYFLGHFPGGYLSDRYGGKIVLSCCTFATIILTILTPVILSSSSMDYYTLIGVQALTGFSTGMLFPSVHSILAHWTPACDRGKLSGIVFCAAQFGVVLNDAVSFSFILHTEAWSSVFYLYSSIAAIWLVVWLIFGQATYRHGILSTQEENAYLDRNLADLVSDNYRKVPWKKMFFSIPLWALIVSHFGHMWIWHVLILDVPEYLMYVLRYNMRNSYFLAALPYSMLAVLTISNGFFMDYLINNKLVKITTSRKVFTTFGAVGPAIFLAAVPFVHCSREAAIILFAVGISMTSFYYTGTRINTLDLAPNYSGTIMGIVNGIGAIPGVIVPHIEDDLIINNTFNEWKALFWLHFFILLCTCIFFISFGSGEVQPWNDYELENRLAHIDAS